MTTQRELELVGVLMDVLEKDTPVITLTYAPEYFIGEETVYRVVESRDDEDRPGTLVLEGYPLVDGCFAPRDKRKWFRCWGCDNDPEIVAAWKALA